MRRAGNSFVMGAHRPDPRPEREQAPSDRLQAGVTVDGAVPLITVIARRVLSRTALPLGCVRSIGIWSRTEAMRARMEAEATVHE
jgi:hypothetical protein